MSTWRIVQPVSSGGPSSVREGAVNWRRLIRPPPPDPPTHGRAGVRGQSRRATRCSPFPSVRRTHVAARHEELVELGQRSPVGVGVDEGCGNEVPRMLVPPDLGHGETSAGEQLLDQVEVEALGNGSVRPHRPSASVSAARAWANSPAMALAKTTARRPATRSERCHRGAARRDGAQVAVVVDELEDAVAADEVEPCAASTLARAAVTLDRGEVVDTGLTGSLARAASASGLGSTTVTRWPSSARGRRRHRCRHRGRARRAGGR